MAMIDKPSFYLWYEFVLAIISTPLNLFVLYCILNVTPKEMREYRSHLAVYQVGYYGKKNNNKKIRKVKMRKKCSTTFFQSWEIIELTILFLLSLTLIIANIHCFFCS